MKYEFDLTHTEAIKLIEVLLDHQDEGPSGTGWPSDELREIRRKIGDGLEKQNPDLDV